MAIQTQKLAFTDSPFCKGRKFCTVCRDRIGGAEWRAAMASSFAMPASGDFECPFGIPWVEPSAPNPLPLGDMVAAAAQPIAAAIDAVAGTRLVQCTTCKKRRDRLNRIGERIAGQVSKPGPEK